MKRSEMRNGAHNESGFTLIEIVVAVAILGISAFMLLEAHFASLNLFIDAEEVATAEFVVQLAVANAEREILSGSEQGEGDIGARYPEFSYSFSAVQPDQREKPGLFEVTVTVTGPNLEEDIRYLVYDGTQVDVGN